MGQVGSNQSSIGRDLEQFRQNQSSWWFPTQNNVEGGCVPGCTSTFSEGLGITLNLSFTYDKSDNLTGANITAGTSGGSSATCRSSRKVGALCNDRRRIVEDGRDLYKGSRTMGVR